MLTFDHYVAPSSIAGVGLFTGVDLNKDQILWTYVPGFDISFTPEQLILLPARAQEYLIHYGWLDKDENIWHISVDGDKYTNHSNRCNTYKDSEGNMRAATDIPAGTEITGNYYEFDLDASHKLRPDFFKSKMLP